MKLINILIISFSIMIFSCRDYPRSNLYDPEGEPSGDSELSISRVEFVDGEIVSGHAEIGEPFKLKVYLHNSGTTPARNVSVHFSGDGVSYPSDDGNWQTYEPIEPDEEKSTSPELLAHYPYSIECDGQVADSADINMLITWQDNTSGITETIHIPNFIDTNLEFSRYEIIYGSLDSGYVNNTFAIKVWLKNTGSTTAYDIFVMYQGNVNLDYYNAECGTESGTMGFLGQEFNDISPESEGTTTQAALDCSSQFSFKTTTFTQDTVTVDVEAKWLGQKDFIAVGTMVFLVK